MRGSSQRRASSSPPSRQRCPPLRLVFLGVLAAAWSHLGPRICAFTTGVGAGLRGSAARAGAAAEGSSSAAASGGERRLLVLGGGGYVGQEVCKLAVERGYTVTSLTRRGENPDPSDERLNAVKWMKGDATNFETVKSLVDQNDAFVHAVGLLFDANSGLTNLNIVVSGSGSVPGDESTYDNITRRTAFNLIEAVKQKFKLPFAAPTPLAFVSAAEAGWPDVSLGEQVEGIAPGWLKEYLVAKRAVEKKLKESEAIRSVVFRPSLIWSWTKFDVLPVIPVFNLASALGVPFVDKTVTVSTLSKAIVAGLEDDAVSGVQRFMEMEELETRMK